MVPCIAIGDGVAMVLAQARPECAAVAVQGISSAAFVASDLARLKPARTAIISLGGSDAPGTETAGSLRRLRQAVTAQRVIWLIPNASQAVRLAVTTVAAEWHDSLIDTRPPMPGQAPPRGLPPGAKPDLSPMSTLALHTAAAADHEAALLACGSSVDPGTLRAIMRVESAGRAAYHPRRASPSTQSFHRKSRCLFVGGRQ
jgi:hypothetical protein